MCCDGDNSGVPLTFVQFIELLQKPPFEPCASELQLLTAAEYDAAFNEAWLLHSRQVTHLIASIIRDYTIVDDLAQDVFKSIYTARASFEKSYICRAARNVAYKELRRRARQRRILYAHSMNIKPRSVSESKEPDTSPLRDPEQIKRGREEALRVALERLPEKFRVPLLLFVEGKTYKQIAEILKTSERAAESRVCIAKSILRRRLRIYL